MEDNCVNEYGFVDTNVAVCPRCGSQVIEIDKDDDIYFCCGEDGESGCEWSGKFAMLKFAMHDFIASHRNKGLRK